MNLRRKRHPEKRRKHKLARRMRRSRRGKGKEAEQSARPRH
jgi:hypothetical protein